jgi:hypothetical protein
MSINTFRYWALAGRDEIIHERPQLILQIYGQTFDPGAPAGGYATLPVSYTTPRIVRQSIWPRILRDYESRMTVLARSAAIYQTRPGCNIQYRLFERQTKIEISSLAFRLPVPFS